VSLRGAGNDLLGAVRFLTRVPVPRTQASEDSLPRTLVWFPLVGLLVGGSAALVAKALGEHLARPVVALGVVTYLVLLTGGLHEDALADAADGFGGGWTRERILLILRDSRIGSYGALALALSLGARVLLLATMPPERVVGSLVAAAVLSRWTALPLAAWLPAARVENDGQGARISGKIPWTMVVVGTMMALVLAAFALHGRAVAAVLAVSVVTGATGYFYRRKIGGVTGDCFGATIQLAEIAVYVCGAWV
jgi:adenosylcobinamide-GDP ribazoletransferase